MKNKIFETIFVISVIVLIVLLLFIPFWLKIIPFAIYIQILLICSTLIYLSLFYRKRSENEELIWEKKKLGWQFEKELNEAKEQNNKLIDELKTELSQKQAKITSLETDIYCLNYTINKLNEEIGKSTKKVIGTQETTSSNSDEIIYKNKSELLEGRVKYLISENNVLKKFASNLTAIPYMAGIVADYETIGLKRMANSLDWGRDVQRQKKVADIRVLRKESKELIEKYKTAEYQLSYLRQLYPIIDDILETEYEQLPTGKSFDDLNENYDTVRNWLSKEEYEKLTVTERNQRALDNYVASHQKTNWQIGRDYEMYIGYKYSLNGYDIQYFGIEKGLEDLGRDIIATKNNEILIIQCKYWSSTKLIHEKHINQLFGTMTCYCIENNLSSKSVKGILVTNTEASEMAKQFAKYLGITIIEKTPLGNYPRIKCNIGHDEYGYSTKIYHLPFDQQYDRTQIKHPGEFYALTVAEAENKGFRRAMKHTTY